MQKEANVVVAFITDDGSSLWLQSLSTPGISADLQMTANKYVYTHTNGKLH